MKTKIWIATLALLSSMATMAQRTPVEKYDVTPYGFEQVYLDGIASNRSKVFETNNGQYIGQVDSENYMYGYGMYMVNDGTQVIGKFRQGRLLFGITMAQQNAIVGSPDFYVSYSLSSGQLEYIVRNNEKYMLEGPQAYDYGFVTMRYPNGDRYVGEIYQHRRHGYGIYYYANGDFWFGEYDNDMRKGFGALYTMNSGLFVGEWLGEEVRRIVHIKRK